MSEELCPQCNHPLSIHQHENWCDECGCGWWIDYGAENATLRKQLEGLTANSIYDRMYEAENQRDALHKQLNIAMNAIKKCPLEINKLKSSDLSNEQAYIIGGMLNILYNALAEIEQIK